LIKNALFRVSGPGRFFWDTVMVRNGFTGKKKIGSFIVRNGLAVHYFY